MVIPLSDASHPSELPLLNYYCAARCQTASEKPLAAARGKQDITWRSWDMCCKLGTGCRSAETP